MFGPRHCWEVNLCTGQGLSNNSSLPSPHLKGSERGRLSSGFLHWRLGKDSPIYRRPSIARPSIARRSVDLIALLLLTTGLANAQSPAAPVVPSESAVLADGAVDALDEVNAARAAAGLPLLIRDPALSAAAASAAGFRARARLFGHTSNDFAFLPAGGRALSAGCAAYPPALGWRSCCTYEGYTHGGAAYAVGDDGRRYMHLFVDRRPTEGATTAVGNTGGDTITTASAGYRNSSPGYQRIRTVGRHRWR